jgi:hypothetical protein
MILRTVLPLCLAAVLPVCAAAQEDICRPGPASNEARTMAVFDVPLAFSAARAPARPVAGRVHAGLELVYLPNVDPAIAVPTICRPDKQAPENTDLLFAAPRPRMELGLPAGFALEASWTPPIRMNDVKANLFGVALSRTQALGPRGMLLELRAHGSFGVVRAPIVCDDPALEDPANPCYQGTRSNDAFRPNVFGLAATAGWTLGGGVVRPYLGAGFNRLMPRFQVHRTNRFDVEDRRKVIVNLNRVALFAGATWQALDRVDLSGEIYSAPSDAVTGRLFGRFRLRD